MEFALSEEQRLLQESVQRTLESVSTLDRVRAHAEGDDPFAQDIWEKLVELGVTATLVPEEEGGLGLGLLEAALVQEALGSAIAPVPFAAAAVMAPVAIGRAGSAAQKSEWLPGIAAGEARFAAAVTETTGVRDGAGVICEGGKLSGTALFALDAGGATHGLVADKERRLHVFPMEEAAVVPLETIDKTRGLAELRFDGAAAEPLSSENDEGAALSAALQAGRVMLAADTLGAAQTMLDKAVAYSRERKQFGRVIGSFQAVKHMCAEMAAELEPCRSLVWYAAYAFDEVPDEAPLMAAHAKALTSEVGRFVARTATEVHGGMGFTDLLGLHYWFKRIGANRQLLGSPERVRKEAAVLQGWIAA